jgi:hypothetical protein
MCDEKTRLEDEAQEAGFRCAAKEIAEGTADHEQAKERGLYRDNQNLRIAWDVGYADAICAYRLGHDVAAMIEIGFWSCPSLCSSAHVITALLDGTWIGPTRPDPRRAPSR